MTIALACDDFKAEDQLEAGDFVVRGLMGASPATGALLLAAEPHLGQRLKFLVRTSHVLQCSAGHAAFGDASSIRNCCNT